ncbi:phycobiliprotein lyase [Oscillatoria sp. CS-180]|uniref:phycobiliprotein lyase n=1 Tax=Oscillatoria sp. CS-180 TaxID=3021720 RepID=UPI00232D9AA3|nr:phycobiliprotein lyase [Oscillatoria sp. CS-180]MDB9528334.1 phycobiliprotein lyase [Oscillatoria sp. CS-180]
MDIVNFFEKVEGIWFSQRTTHFSPDQPSQTGQTLLQITRVNLSESRVVDLCQQASANPDEAVVALLIQQESQQSTYRTSAPVAQGPTLLIGFKSEDEASGKFLSQTGQEAIVPGHYQLKDEVLTFTIRTDEFQSDERIWYMNPNLRMRTSLVKRADGFQMSSFCSELRRSSK